MSTSDNISKLKKNTAILAIATIGSKGISFLLAPLYSYYMSSGDYGIMDIVLTTVYLIAPIACADIYEAVFRYSNEDNLDKSDIVSSSIYIYLIGAIVSAFVGIILTITVPKHSTTIIGATLLILLNGIVSIFSQYVRGVGNVREFAISGLVSAIAQLVLVLVFMVAFGMGYTGWLIAYLFSQLITFVYLSYKSRVIRQCSLSKININTCKKLLQYSIPLIPTSVIWWVMNASDRYIIGLTLGVSLNGIYAVANKIPNILSVFESVFYQAWQTSAIEARTEDRHSQSILYSKIFNNYLSIMLIGYAAVLVISRPFITYLFDQQYNDAWLYIPPLLAGVVIHALDGNLGTNYTVFLKTKGALTTSLWGAFVNIVLNIVFIPLYGLWAAAITTLLGYVVILILRWRDSSRFVKITIDKKRLFLLVGLIIIQTLLYYQNLIAAEIGMVIIFSLTVIVNKDLLLKLGKKNGKIA